GARVGLGAGRRRFPGLRPPDRAHPARGPVGVLMDGVTLLVEGFASALTPSHLLWSLIGVTIGTAVGVLPGIVPALTVALLLPITFLLEPSHALVILAYIYY